MYSEIYFLGRIDGIKSMIALVNYIINDYKNDSNNDLLEFLKDFQEEIDICSEIIKGEDENVRR